MVKSRSIFRLGVTPATLSSLSRNQKSCTEHTAQQWQGARKWHCRRVEGKHVIA
jgi:hypothetical protein